MSYFENKQPKIFGDRLMVFVDKTLKELYHMEYVVIQRADLFHDDMDIQNLGHMQNRLRSIYGALSTGTYTGDQGLVEIRDGVLEAFRDLVDRLLESGSFPELQALDEL